MRSGKKAGLVGEVAIYGKSGGPSAAIASWKEGGETKTKAIGYGGQFGERLMLGSLTEALWLACAALREAGIQKGKIAVHIQVGEAGLMAAADVNHPGYFGDLKFGPGPVYVISGAELEAAAQNGVA